MRHILFPLLALLAAACWSGPPSPDTPLDAHHLVAHQDGTAASSAVTANEGMDASLCSAQPTRGGFEVGSLQLPATGSSSVHAGSCMAEEDGWVSCTAAALGPDAPDALGDSHEPDPTTPDRYWHPVNLALVHSPSGSSTMPPRLPAARADHASSSYVLFQGA